MPDTLISARTGSATSAAVTVGVSFPGDYRTAKPETRPSTFVAHGLGVGEYVKIEVSNDGGTTFAEYFLDGVSQRLSGDTADKTNARTINAVGVFRANKATTAGSVAVVLSTPKNP